MDMSSHEILNRIDSLVERVTSRVNLSASVSLHLEEAAQAVASLCGANQTEVRGADKEQAVSLLIPVPEQYASRFPDSVVHNKGNKPHLTVLYVQPEMGPGETSKVLHLARAVLRTVAPFRLFVDAQSGLRSFDGGEAGEKALWLSARSEPRGELERLHRLLRSTLDDEGVEIASDKDFVPHVTWTYAPSDISDEEIRRMDNRISDRFSRGFWFDVKHVMLSTPNSTKPIALNPMPKSSIY